MIVLYIIYFILYVTIATITYRLFKWALSHSIFVEEDASAISGGTCWAWPITIPIAIGILIGVYINKLICKLF